MLCFRLRGVGSPSWILAGDDGRTRLILLCCQLVPGLAGLVWYIVTLAGLGLTPINDRVCCCWSPSRDFRLIPESYHCHQHSPCLLLVLEFQVWCIDHGVVLSLVRLAVLLGPVTTVPSVHFSDDKQNRNKVFGLKLLHFQRF